MAKPPTKTYVLIIEEREEDAGPYADAGIFGFTDAAGLREWVQRQLDEIGPFDASYTVRVSK